jgi:diacylglycerol kinase (ATP)
MVIDMLSQAIGTDNIYDLAEHNPKDVLESRFSRGETVQQLHNGRGLVASDDSNHDEDVSDTGSTPLTRILVAGGDGTVTWVLGAIADLDLDPAPPVAVFPLGTGNDLAINLGWGKKFRQSSINTPKRLQKLLNRIGSAKATSLDYWNVEISNFDATASRCPPPPGISVDCRSTATCKFWNYFSIGLDAESAYKFHLLRENHPKFASSRLLNQAWYGVFTCGTGWFCGGRPLDRYVESLRIKQTIDGEWRVVPVPSSIRAIILLNLQTYAGGRDIWGRENEKNLERKGMKPPRRDDGLIEVIGFKNGWHTAAVIGEIHLPNIHGKRLAQGASVEVILRDTENPKSLCMQLDGEPWKNTLHQIDHTTGQRAVPPKNAEEATAGAIGASAREEIREDEREGRKEGGHGDEEEMRSSSAGKVKILVHHAGTSNVLESIQQT